MTLTLLGGDQRGGARRHTSASALPRHALLYPAFPRANARKVGRGPAGHGRQTPAALLEEENCWPQLVAHLRETGRGCGRSGSAGSVTRTARGDDPAAMATETTSVYDHYVEVLEAGGVEALKH